MRLSRRLTTLLPRHDVHSITTVALLGFGAWACGDGDGRRGADLAWDSAGIRIVQNAARDSSNVVWWSVEPTPVTDIGRLAAGEAHALHEVRGAIRLADGRIAVANGSTADIRFYAPDGTHLRTVGGQGEGPGEFQSPTALLLLSGDSIGVYDNRARRISIFDRNGSFVRQIPTTGLNTSAATLVTLNEVFADGSLIATFRQDVPTSNRITQVQRPILTLSRISTDGAVLDTIVSVPGSERLVIVNATEGRISGITITAPPFARATSIAAGDSVLFVGTQDTPQVEVYSEKGDLVRIIRLGTEMRPVTPPLVEAWIDRAVEHLDNDRELQRRAELRAAPIAEAAPPYGMIEIDAAGNLWIEDYSVAESPTASWTVLDQNGILLARSHLPASLRVQAIGEDYVLGVERDDMDVEHVRLYRLRKVHRN